MEQPWLEKKAWRDNHIRSGARYAHWVMLVFALMWNGISAPILWQTDELLAPQFVQRRLHAVGQCLFAHGRQIAA